MNTSATDGVRGETYWDGILNKSKEGLLQWDRPWDKLNYKAVFGFNMSS